MAFIVQTGVDAVDGATAYISVSFFKDYHSTRGVSLTGVTDESIEFAIVKATDYIDTRFSFKGTPKEAEHSLAWPRNCVYDSLGNVFADTPKALKKSCAEYAFIALNSELAPTPDYDSTGRAVVEKTEKVGPLLEITRYSENGPVFVPKRFPKIDGILLNSGLVVSGITLVRG